VIIRVDALCAAAAAVKSTLSLRQVLIVPYVVLVLGLALVIGILSYRTGSQAVSTVSEHLLHETVGRIAQAIDRHIVGSGAALEAAFPAGTPAPVSVEADLKGRRTRLWIATSLNIDPNNYVDYGNRAGQSFGIYRHSLDEAELRIKLKACDMRSRFRFGAIDGDLNIDSVEERLFDPRERPWYKAGAGAASDNWTAVYIDFGTQELVATRARRMLSGTGEVEGVVATDVSLRGLNRFVGSLRVSPHGQAFIVEPDGKLIASSAGPNVRRDSGATTSRLTVAESANPLLSALYAEVGRLIAGGELADQPRTMNFAMADGEQIYAAFHRIRDNAGLDWITLVAIPRSDFMSGVVENLERTVLLSALAALASVGVGLWILNWVAGDLSRLSLMAQKVGQGDLDAPVDVKRRDEIGDLARSFETMQLQLQSDPLTGLANRESFVRQVNAKVARYRADPTLEGAFAILFIDLDGFKQVNDRYGHNWATAFSSKWPRACAATCARATWSAAMPATNSS
jgi:HAMP domain-containing protein